jgi:putative flippase GtrA
MCPVPKVQRPNEAALKTERVPPATGRGSTHFLHRFISHIPRGQVLRYILIGAWNTLFGFLAYAGLTLVFARLTKFYPYVFASLLANLISITVSFLGYKWFVFKTRGNYLREWLRAVSVYAVSITITTSSLPPLVGLLRHTTPYPRLAPYIAGAIISACSVTMSFFGHKYFSFKPKKQAAALD